ncbi:MAG: hypothetical protein AB7V46_21560, partial [Thermomicrobiales bacterium]
EFAAEEQATQALAFISALTIADPEFVRVEGTGVLGQNAVYGRKTFGEGQELSYQLQVIFQSGPVIAVIDLIDYLGQEPSITEIEALATLQHERIQEGIQSGSLGLGNKVPRMIEPEFGSFYEIRRDEYLRRDGVDIPRNLEDPGVAAVRAQLAGDATDVYALQQFVDNADEINVTLPEQFGIGTRVYRFHDDTTASAWLADRPNQIQAEYQISGVGVQDIQVLAGGPQFGDESVTLSYTELDTFGGPVFRVFLRVANSVADVRFTPLGEGSVAIAESYAAFQASCLVETCPSPFLMTDVLLGQPLGQGPSTETPTTGMTPAVGITPTPGVPASPPEVLDLAAMTLMPRDLEDGGLTGFGSSYGEMIFREELIASTATSRGLPDAEVRAAFEGNGLVRRYEHFLYTPLSASDPAGEAAQLVVSYVVEFTDESGAASAWSFMEDESFSATSVDTPLRTPLGQQSEASRDRGVDDAGTPFEQLDITFQIGNLHAGVAVVDWTGSPVDQRTAEALAARLLQRIEAVRAGGAPGLSGMVNRLSGVEVLPLADEYFLLDGESIRAYGQSLDDSVAVSDMAASERRVDGYRMQQQLTSGTDATEDDTWYFVSLEAFADTASASQWIAGTLQRIGANPDLSNVQIIDGTGYGDASVLYTASSADGVYQYQGAVLQVGAMVVAIDLVGSDAPSEVMLDSILQQQITCLQEGGCVAPMAVPSVSPQPPGGSRPGRN